MKTISYDPHIIILPSTLKQALLLPDPVHLGYSSLIRCMVCEYLLSFWRLPFLSLDYLLCCVEAFGLMRSHFFNFAFVACAFGVLSKKSSSSPMSWDLSSVLSFRSCTVSGVPFQTSFHFFCSVVLMSIHRDVQRSCTISLTIVITLFHTWEEEKPKRDTVFYL